jgi:hypothetical protein
LIARGFEAAGALRTRPIPLRSECCVVTALGSQCAGILGALKRASTNCADIGEVRLRELVKGKVHAISAYPGRIAESIDDGSDIPSRAL